MSAATTPSTHASPAHARRILIVLATAALFVSFVETMLTPALPDLATFFSNAPYTTVAWILTAYLLVGVATIPIFSKLGDVYGKRRILAIVLSVYAVAVALTPITPILGAEAGLTRAQSIYLLIATRGLQGIGLAMFPLALAMAADSLPKERIAPAQGLVAAMFGVGSALGLVGGSGLIESLGWQVAYASIVAPVALLPILARTWLPEGHRGTGSPIDYLAAGLLGGGLALFLLGVTLGPTWGWTAWAPAALSGRPFGAPMLFVLALLLILGFVARSLRSPHPLIDLGRLRERNIAIGYTGAILVGLAMYSAFVALTVLVEYPIVGLGLSILSFGLMSIPTTAAMFVAGPLVGRGIARYGPRPMILLGSSISAAGFALLLAFHGTFLELIVESVPTFVGLVAILVSVTNVIAVSSRRGESGIHMGLTEMFQDLGASVGPVVVASLLATFTRIVRVPSGDGPAGSVSALVPSATAFDLIFAFGLATVAAAGVFGMLLHNYVATPSAVPTPDPPQSELPAAPVSERV